MNTQTQGYRLGRILGFPIYADPTILMLVVIFVLFGLRGGLGGVLDQVVFFSVLIGSVVWHEIGHAVAVRKQHNTESIIVLGGLGGRCVYRAQPSPKQGIIVALAGPAFGLAVGVVAFVIHALLDQPPYFLYLLAYVNIILNLGNLVPMYPLDGGQVLFYGLRSRFSRKKAETLTALITFGVLGVTAVLLLAFVGTSMILIWIILAFIGFEAWRLYQQSRRRKEHYSHYDDEWR